MPSNERFKVVKVNCSSCGGNLRNHDILREFSTTWEDDEEGLDGGTDYQICQCKGCETIRFRNASWDTSEIDPGPQKRGRESFLTNDFAARGGPAAKLLVEYLGSR